MNLLTSTGVIARPGDIPGIMEYSGIDKGMIRY